MALGIAVLAANLVAAAVGAATWLKKRARWSIAFWPLLRIAQAVVAAQVLLGLLLAASGETAPDGLHIVYGISPLVVSLGSEALRAGVAQRELEGVEDLDALERPEQVALAKRVALSEVGVMTIGALLIVTLALRAYQTGG
jgi:hypothetical protein